MRQKGPDEERRFGLIDKTGMEVVSLIYDYMIPHMGTPGVYLGVCGDRTDIIDCGRVVGHIKGFYRVHPTDRYISAECGGENIPYSGRAARGGKEALFDLSGKMILPPRYESVRPQGDFAGVRDGGKWGVVGLPGGNLIVPLIYDAIGMFDEEGYAIARYDDDSFVIHID